MTTTSSVSTSTSSSGTVTFSGLASGVDTASIVESLMAAEKVPLTKLQDKEEYLNTQLDTYTSFNDLLDTFYSSVIGLNTRSDVNTFEVTNTGSDYFSISTTSLANEGSYSVQVVSLAQQQKDLSSNYVSDTGTTLLSGQLQFGDETLDYSDTTMSDLVTQINTGDYGLTASIINDGTGSGYKLMFTNDTAGEDMDIQGTGSITIDTATDGHTVEASKAHVVVDGVDYYSSSNTVSTAIKGASLTLLAASSSTTSRVVLSSDAEDNISSKLQELVDNYNAITSFVDDVSASDASLGRSLKSMQRSIRNYISSSSLVALGISSDYETGELSFDEDTFNAAYEEDSESVLTSLFGTDDTDGIMSRLDDYMSTQMSSSSGYLATKKKSIDENISRIEDSISMMELRLEKRQKTLEAQFSAMETLVSSLNSQQEYLTNFFSDSSSSS